MNDLNYEEAAVNLPNKGYIEHLPDDIIVEVPGIVNNNGVSGVKLKNYINDHEVQSQKPGGERGVFFELFNRYNYLPITTDSHLGEYIQWAYSVADHEAILDFYT